MYPASSLQTASCSSPNERGSHNYHSLAEVPEVQSIRNGRNFSAAV